MGPCGVTIPRMDEPIIYRTEVLGILGALADIIFELKKITRFLPYDEEEEKDPDD
jgi:hypothetical protein